MYTATYKFVTPAKCSAVMCLHATAVQEMQVVHAISNLASAVMQGGVDLPTTLCSVLLPWHWYWGGCGP